jgi:hypothetical protein
MCKNMKAFSKFWQHMEIAADPILLRYKALVGEAKARSGA